ncbi:hypothetical protein [Nocardiopsis chromatogenes]|uniref:hypothetical protein n=1 Tax=Nocardiopsis chromatogenes TaxID=280239 RepID=UPI000347859B|nr:hypothetical protein [Nocardiopsis chromatogenes]
MAGNPMDLPEDQRWWYCLKHDRVEKGAGCPNKFRLGPYADEASAAGALHTVAERNEAWEASDDPWEQDR